MTDSENAVSAERIPRQDVGKRVSGSGKTSEGRSGCQTPQCSEGPTAASEEQSFGEWLSEQEKLPRYNIARDVFFEYTQAMIMRRNRITMDLLSEM